MAKRKQRSKRLEYAKDLPYRFCCDVHSLIGEMNLYKEVFAAMKPEDREFLMDQMLRDIKRV